MLCIVSLKALALAVTLSVSSVLAHPAFTGTVVSAREVKNEYDYVVVGAGAAGLTIANRLSEQKSKLRIVFEPGAREN